MSTACSNLVSLIAELKGEATICVAFCSAVYMYVYVYSCIYSQVGRLDCTTASSFQSIRDSYFWLVCASNPFQMLFRVHIAHTFQVRLLAARVTLSPF